MIQSAQRVKHGLIGERRAPHHFARAAPTGGEIHEHRLLAFPRVLQRRGKIRAPAAWHRGDIHSRKGHERERDCEVAFHFEFMAAAAVGFSFPCLIGGQNSLQLKGRLNSP